jgi:hypothetical protein
MSASDSVAGEYVGGEFVRPPAKFFPEEAVATALALSKDERSPSALELMISIRDELEKRLAVLSTHSPEFSTYANALTTVRSLVDEIVDPVIDELMNSID